MSADGASTPPHFVWQLPDFAGEDGRFQRLVLAAAEQIAERGTASVATRSVAAAAGVAPSAIAYNFGSLERLFSRAFAHGAALCARWIEAREAEVLALPRTPDGAVLALEHVVTAWTRGARPLALLYQECLAETAGEGPGRTWTGQWRDFWLRAAEGFGLGELEGRLMHLFFESEALYHLSGWSPALEGAALRELAETLGSVWLGAAPRAPLGAVALAIQNAGALSAHAIAPAAGRIVEAAAEVAEAGLGGLTHRAVAARAGVTTGAVTHHFRTVEDLLAGAIRGQVLALSRTSADGPAPPVVEQIGTVEDFFAAARFHNAAPETPAGPALRRRNLFLAAVRRPELAGAGAVIRFAHGGTARESLSRIARLPPASVTLPACVLSRLLAPLWFACSADPDPRPTRERLADEIGLRLMPWLEAAAAEPLARRAP